MTSVPRSTATPIVMTGGPPLIKGFFWLLTAMVLVLHFVPGSGIVVFIAITIHSLRGSRQALESMTLLAFLLIVNKAVAPVDISAFRWLVLFAAFGRVMWDSFMMGGKQTPFVAVIILFSISIGFLSLLTSYIPLVSILKITSFALALLTVFMAAAKTQHLHVHWNRWFTTFAFFVVVASVPLYLMDAGYQRNGVGFQGILTHPQTFGAVMAMFTAFFTGRLLFEGELSKVTLFGAICGWFGIFASLARTALLAVLLGLIALSVLGYFVVQNWRPQISRALSLWYVQLGIIAFMAVSVLQFSAISESIQDFLTKDAGTDASITESLMSSRSYLINRSMANFRSSPLTGIGFGVPSDFSYGRVQTGAFGLPVGASVEKGFMPSAVLEETGIVGAILVLIMLTLLFRPLVRVGRIPMFWMASVAVLVNLGEMVFFSVGGMGMLVWIVLAFTYTDAITPKYIAVIETEYVPA